MCVRMLYVFVNHMINCSKWKNGNERKNGTERNGKKNVHFYMTSTVHVHTTLTIICFVCFMMSIPTIHSFPCLPLLALLHKLRSHHVCHSYDMWIAYPPYIHRKQFI